jgi:hypothetical protein
MLQINEKDIIMLAINMILMENLYDFVYLCEGCRLWF